MSSFANYNWRYDEIQELLSIRSDVDIVDQVSGTARDAVVYQQITSRLRDRGIFRTKAQVTNKLKMLKRQFLQIITNDQDGDEAKGWPYYSLCNAVWGSAAIGSKKPTSTDEPYNLRLPARSSRDSDPRLRNITDGESSALAENLDSVDPEGILDRKPSTPESSQHEAPDAATLLHCHDKPSTSTEDFWSDQETQVMLDLIKQHKRQTPIQSDGRKNREIFRMLSEGMAERGFGKSEGQIRTKWCYLKRCYKAAVSNQTDGSGTGHFVFFEVLKELLGDLTMASSNSGQEGIDKGFDEEICNSVDPGDSFYRPSTSGHLNRPDVTSQWSPQENPSRKRKRLSNGASSNRHFLEQLQVRQQAWFAAQMRPFHLRENRMLTLLESLVQTSERMVTVMTDCLQQIGQQHSGHSTVPRHHQNTSRLSSAPSEGSFQDEDFFGLE